MKTFKIHLKGSNTPMTVRCDVVEYTKEFLLIKAQRRITGRYLRSETQGFCEVLPESDSELPNLVKPRKRGPRPEIAPSTPWKKQFSIQ